MPLLYPSANRLAGHDYTLNWRHIELPPEPQLIRCEQRALPMHGLMHATPHWRTTYRGESRSQRAWT